MNLKEIKELIKIIDSSNLSEIHIEQEDIKLTLKKEIIVNQISNHAENDYVIREAKQENNRIDNIEPKKENEHLHIIKSPIVGVFYSSPNPSSPNYVKVGDKVKVGSTLCIVEAMKMMNEITSDVDGEITEIIAQNQCPVEFGQPLFKIRKV